LGFQDNLPIGNQSQEKRIMNNEVPEQKIVCFVEPGGEAVVYCPKCGEGQTLDTRERANTSFKASCKCGALLKGRLEYRKSYRKNVSLAGSYRVRGSGVRGKIIVENVSMKGVGFTCLRKHNLQAGDQLDVTFVLDNRQKSTVKLWVKVMNIDLNYVGTSRCDTSIEQPDLGFYLR
jgi:hypothetical protein